MGSDKFRKDPLYAHTKSVNHAACVMRNDSSNKPIKDTPVGKAMVRLQKEQHHKLTGLFYTAYAITKNCRPFRSRCCVLCKIGSIKITPLKCIANQMSCLFLYYCLIMQNSLCQTFTIRDLDNHFILPGKSLLHATCPGTSFVKNICRTLIH